jgi:hypothetical protein
MHTPTNQQYYQSKQLKFDFGIDLMSAVDDSPNYRSNNYANENYEWHRRSPSPTSRYK